MNKRLKSGKIFNYYCSGPGIPIQIRPVKIINHSSDHIKMQLLDTENPVITIVRALDEYSDFNHIFF